MFLIIFVFISPTKIKIRTIQVNHNLMYLFLISTAVLLCVPIFKNFGFHYNLNTLLLQDIYATRDVFTAHSSQLLDYIYNWEVKAIIPVALVFSLIWKKYVSAFFAFFILIYLYVISGNKAVYLTSVVSLFFYFMGKNYLQKTTYFLCIISLIFIFIPLLDVFILHGIVLRGTFVMRLMYIPSLLNVYYFDFFSNQSMYFSESHLFNHYFQSPYSTNVAWIISKVYFNATDVYSNNGIISDGYMNLGYLGIALFSILFSLLFMFFNSIKVDKKYYGIFFIYIFFFLSTPMFTVLITGGLWILVIFAFFIMHRKLLVR